MTDRRPFPSRLERLPTVDSTQRVVREWLAAGQPEVCVCVADQQTAGRGRQGRGWIAPPGAALLLSCGFRPRGLAARHAWRLAATVSLAMLDAAEEAAGLREGTLWLKWPNDIVVDAPDGGLRKLAGVLGEAADTGRAVETVVIGIGINADWAKEAFPVELAGFMTSLRQVSGGRPVDRENLLEAFLDRLEPRYEALQAGHFDAGGWSTRQRTTGREVEILVGPEIVAGTAVGVDPERGALLVETSEGQRAIDSGDVIRCRVLGLMPAAPDLAPDLAAGS
ncbi:MAG: biotin--[acetyl-CoA-carboxylase] ligase [Chloroflexi bacterium]|nr:biotin--[acetyl-CoA-carboxylase] ligase [Chloroflexota bacterium]